MLHRTASTQSQAPRWRRRAALLATLAATLPLAMVTAGSPARAGTMFDLVNPSFASGTTGWYASTTRGALGLTPGRTGNAARLTHSATWGYPVILNDKKNTVASTVAGSSYTATAWVRASSTTTVAIRLQEWRDGVKRGETISTVTVGTTWTLIGVNYVAQTNGAQLDLNVYSPKVAPGGSLDVDDVDFGARAPVWRDDFSGTSLDGTNWTALNKSTFGDGNGELACLMNRPENLSVSGGMLSLRAQRETTPLVCGTKDTRFPTGRSYSSAFVQTKDKRSFTYGRFEMRAKLPTAQGTSKGLWPAFWMRPDDGGVGELDIMEAVGSSSTGTEYTKAHQSIHYDYVRTYAMQTNTAALSSGARPSDGFHTYAAEWDATRILWFIDGKLVYHRDATTTPWLASTFNRPMHLKLNLAVGGSWPGSPDASTTLPASYDIDYVAVHGKPAA